MKTRQYAPWNLKPGMLLASLTQRWDGKPYHIGRIVSVTRSRGYFTGGSVWRVTTDMGEKLMYHGKTHPLPAERVRVLTEA